MFQLKKSLTLALGLAVLGTTAILITTSSVGASPRINPVNAAPQPPSVPVTVVNTPLPVSGTVNANIGTPTVNVASLPAITGNVNATLTNSSVTVNNSAANPIQVRAVNNAASNPYYTGGCSSPAQLQGCAGGPGYDTITVPSTTDSGQPITAVEIDLVSGSCFSVPGGEIVNVAFTIRPPSGVGPFGVNAVPVVTYSDSSSIDYAFSQQTHIYALAGSTLVIGESYRTAYSATAPPPLFCSMSIIGNYVLQ